MLLSSEITDQRTFAVQVISDLSLSLVGFQALSLPGQSQNQSGTSPTAPFGANRTRSLFWGSGAFRESQDTLSLGKRIRSPHLLGALHPSSEGAVRGSGGQTGAPVRRDLPDPRLLTGRASLCAWFPEAPCSVRMPRPLSLSPRRTLPGFRSYGLCSPCK